MFSIFVVIATRCLAAGGLHGRRAHQDSSCVQRTDAQDSTAYCSREWVRPVCQPTDRVSEVCMCASLIRKPSNQMYANANAFVGSLSMKLIIYA